MKFGIILLLVIGVSSIGGTVIPQNNPLAFYKREYNPIVFFLISTLSLHMVYTSWWFITMMSVLVINLTLCSVIRFPTIIRQFFKVPELERELERKTYLIKREFSKEVDVNKLFKKLGFYRIKKQESEKGNYYYGFKNRFGYLGSWLSHVGLLIIIVSYMFGKATGFDTYIYGVAGTSKAIEGTPYIIKIEDFSIDFREDHSVNQYISEITLIDNTGKVVKDTGELSVNNPYRADDFSIYQNGTGWAVDMTLMRNGEVIANRILYQNEIHVDDNQKIALQFTNFYPDLVRNNDMPATKSPYPNNPALLYTLFYEGQRADMNVVEVGDEVTWEEYTFTISNPRNFTLLQIVSDPGIQGAKVGGLVLLHGIMFSFYFHPKQLKALKKNDGGTIIWGDTNKDQELFREKIIAHLDQIEIE